jgi:uncharacterized protein (TIGR02646 family)
MRYVDRGRAKVPPFLLSDRVRSAIVEMEQFLRLPDTRRLQRRAPYDQSIVQERSVRSALTEAFFSKCAWCERPHQHPVIEQFRPRQYAQGDQDDAADHYAWLAYDWENLLIACADCSKRKGSYFPVEDRRARLFCTVAEARKAEAPLILDPTFDDPRAHLHFRLNGEYAFTSPQGALTGEILGLNRPELVNARRDTILQLEDRVLSRASAADLREFLWSGAPFCGAATQYMAWLIAEVTGSRPRWGRGGATLNSVSRALLAFEPHLVRDRISRMRDLDEALVVQWTPPAPDLGLRSAPEWRRPSAALRSIHLENFKGVEDLTINIPAYHREEGGTGCLMLLGENAAGKSSVLEAVALALIGEKAASKLISAETLLRRKGSDRYQLVAAEPTRVTLEFFDHSEPTILHIDPLARLFEGEAGPRSAVIAYGPRRYSETDAPWREASLERVKGLFKPAVPIADSTRWLQSLARDDRRLFSAVARGLREVLALHDDDDLVLDEDMGICVRAHGRLTPIDRMSEGYRSLFAMALDIMRELLRLSPELESARAVVLIDEVETHLHPRWKVRVMAALRRALPNVTFIATTHDPLCLRGMDDGEVVVLFKDIDQRVAKLEELPSIKGMRAEQILTSDFFGLNSTADPAVDKALADYVATLTRAQTTRSADDAGVAHALEQNLADTLMLGDTPGDQVIQEALGRYLVERRDLPPIARSAARREVVEQMLGALRRPLES